MLDFLVNLWNSLLSWIKGDEAIVEEFGDDPEEDLEDNEEDLWDDEDEDLWEKEAEVNDPMEEVSTAVAFEKSEDNSEEKTLIEDLPNVDDEGKSL